MEMMMSRQSVSLNRQRFFNPVSYEARYKRRFYRALQAWNDADSLAADLAEKHNIIRDERTCQRWRAGSNMPREQWLCDLLMEMAVEQTRHQIRALEQRLTAIGG